MNNIIYIIIKIIFYFNNNSMDWIIKFFRYKGINIGENCKIYSNIITSESYLISIKNNVTISNDVQLVTHDNSIIKINKNYTDLFGKIEIGANCFIGARSIILPGVKLANNIIVGSGAVVTKSFYEENIIIGGNPAKKIRKIDSSYIEFIEKKGINISKLSEKIKKNVILENEDRFLKK